MAKVFARTRSSANSTKARKSNGLSARATRTWAAKASLAVLLATFSAPVLANDFVQPADTPSGPIRVLVRPLGDAVPAPAPPATGLRIGVSYFGMMSGVIANALDETGKFTVVAPSHLPVTNVNANTPIKSDVRAAVEVVCSAAKLNYAVFGTKDEMSIGAPSISMFGVGRPAKSVMFGLRVYDCKTGAIVWDSLVAIEDHQPIWDTAQSGVFTFYTGDSPSVGSKVIVAKMMSDLGW